MPNEECPPWLKKSNLTTAQKLANAKAALDYAMTHNLAAVSETLDGNTITRDFTSQMKYITYLDGLLFRENPCNGITIIGTYV